MTASDPMPASAPQDEVEGDEDDLLADESLRAALRPPGLPLPWPTSVLEAAHRVDDLLDLGRAREARLVAESFAGDPAPLRERIRLLTAWARALDADGSAAQADQLREEEIALIAGAGYLDHARVLLELLRERRQERRTQAGAPASADAEPAPAQAAPAQPARKAPRGRRRAAAVTVDESRPLDDALYAVLSAATLPPLLAAPGETVPSADALTAREHALISALDALAEAQDRLLGDLDPMLRVRLAMVLADMGRMEEAAAQAGFVLDDLEGEGAVDLDRSLPLARAVFANARLNEDPEDAAGWAVLALRDLADVDSPRRRVSLISTLVLALGGAGLEREADYAAERLASLLRSLPEGPERVRPLLIVAAQRITAGRDVRALEALADVRRIIRFRRDHRSELLVRQLAASAHERAGRYDQALDALDAAATMARWLGDDLGATAEDRAVHMLAELDARAHAMRIALDAGRLDRAEDQASRILDRIEPHGGRPVLDPVSQWDREVDARLGLMLAAGVAAASADGGETDGASADAPATDPVALYEGRRDEAARAIAAAPVGHEERQAYWTDYLADRDEAMTQLRG